MEYKTLAVMKTTTLEVNYDKLFFTLQLKYVSLLCNHHNFTKVRSRTDKIMIAALPLKNKLF